MMRLAVGPARLQSIVLEGFPDWWKSIEADPRWEHGAFYGLSVAYAIIAAVALTQLLRIEKRVPEYGWTTQKVFHLLNHLVCMLRAIAMGFRMEVQSMHQVLLKALLNDVPGLLFFSTYTLLVLFWAEIYHQARSQPTTQLRPTFLISNIAVYAVQILLLLVYGLTPAESTLHQCAQVGSAVFLVLVSLAAAAGFVMYGGRLFVMLRRFPIESRGRQKKLREVGAVTAVCTLCFVARAVMIAASAIDARDFQLDVMRHPLLNIAYYTTVELVPSALVLFILRKLPPKRTPVYSHPDLEGPPSNP